MPESDSANIRVNYIFVRAWFACKLLYHYTQFILLSHLVFVLHNGGEGFGKSGSCQNSCPHVVYADSTAEGSLHWCRCIWQKCADS